jgi:hypothetical protein
MLDERIMRDFSARDEEEQQAFLTQTWCDNCQQANLGMHAVIEYEHKGILFIEGKCKRCDQPVLTELTDDDF